MAPICLFRGIQHICNGAMTKNIQAPCIGFTSSDTARNSVLVNKKASGRDSSLFSNFLKCTHLLLKDQVVCTSHVYADRSCMDRHPNRK